MISEFGRLLKSIAADDLPLNVSRETLQSTRFMAQAKQVLVKRFISLMTKIAAEEPHKYERLVKAGYSPLLKHGIVQVRLKKRSADTKRAYKFGYLKELVFYLFVYLVDLCVS